MTSVKQRRKTKRVAVIAIGGLLLVAVLCFVFGFAISEGWEAVGRWFTSKWAALSLIAIGVVAFALVFAYFRLKDAKDFK